MLAVGVVVWLGSEFMFFSGLFAAFFTIRAHNMPHWPPGGTFPAGTKLDTIQALVFTFVLLASSPTFQFGVWAQERGEYKKARNWIITSFVLGAAFLGNQAYEWKTLPSRPHTNAYGSLFYIMSGLHGLHVLLGLVAMVALLGRLAGSIKGGTRARRPCSRRSATTGTSSTSSGSGSSAPCSCSRDRPRDFGGAPF